MNLISAVCSAQLQPKQFCKKIVWLFKYVISSFVLGKWKTHYRGRCICLSWFYHLSPFTSKLSNPTLNWQSTFILYPQLPLKVRNNSQKALTKAICYFPLNFSSVKTHEKFSRLLMYSDQCILCWPILSYCLPALQCKHLLTLVLYLNIKLCSIKYLLFCSTAISSTLLGFLGVVSIHVVNAN